MLDVFSPSNSIFTNPEVINHALQTGGSSFVDGFQRFLDDFSRNLNREPPAGADKFHVGKEVAVTPGKVVYRNHLIEFIQYAPSTDTVHGQPLLIVSAWIMKFYILDLSPENSLIRYLVGQGFTVFCISWRNVTAADRNLGLDDYRRLGVMAALAAIRTIVPDSKVHGIGYCLGGTLLSIAAAMAHVEDDRLASMTLLAAQTDFSEPGELELFIDHSQLESLEGLMWQLGYLPAFHMAGAFQLLRSNDLIWSRLLRHYLMGEPPAMNDLIAWNADATRLPYRMHSEYLTSLFLNSDLAAGRYVVDEHPVAGADLRRRHRMGSHRTMAVRLQDPLSERHRRNFCTHQWRPQCRNRQRARPSEAALQARAQGGGGPVPARGPVERAGRTARRLLVASMGRLAASEVIGPARHTPNNGRAKPWLAYSGGRTWDVRLSSAQIKNMALHGAAGPCHRIR